MLESNILARLHERGLIEQTTPGLDDLLKTQKVAVFCGFDATADSLHVGHLLSVLTLKAFQEHGHAVWPLCGTGTALVGDPTGRSTMRPMLATETLEQNIQGVTTSLNLILDQAVIRNDWLREINLIEFLRDIGAKMPLSHLLALDAVKNRDGVSVLEAFYPLLQAFDFLHLARRAHQQEMAIVQIGGSDQWGNICTGLELIQKAEPGIQAHGLTIPLLTNARGEKMGKTSGGAVWLLPEKLETRQFWNFWRNIEDSRLNKIRAIFQLHAVDSIDHRDINAAKMELATTVTTLVRGEEAARAAQAQQESLFNGSVEGLTPLDVDPNWDLPALLVHANLASSRTNARMLIQQSGVRIYGKIVQTIPNLNGVHRLSVGKKKHIAIKTSRSTR